MKKEKYEKSEEQIAGILLRKRNTRRKCYKNNIKVFKI